jgi:hypothetical protein
MTCDPQDDVSTAEAQAIAGWPAEANARVVRSEVLSPDAVDVIVTTEPDHEMRVHMRRVEGRWEDHGDIVE